MTPNSYKKFFQLDPEVVFLNHGSFGACPNPVFKAYQRWQRELERQPVRFMGREYPALLLQARKLLAEYLSVDADELVFVPNATHGVNSIAHSITLQPGDEVLSSDHEYGACDNAWSFTCQQRGARYVRQPVPLPARTDADVIETIWQGVTERTKVLYLSHITSPTAQLWPVKELCTRAKARGILTLIDGAHAPGQIPLDLRALGADFYTGNCHKWMLAPKGAGFLYARRELHGLLQPLVVSWGYAPQPAQALDSRLVDLFQWVGTRDPSAYLSVPEAIRFMEAHNWAAVQAKCRALLGGALREIAALTGEAVLYSAERPNGMMAAAPLPRLKDPAALQAALYEQYKIEVPIIHWNGRDLARISVQAYNTPQELELLVQALGKLLTDHAA